MNKVFANFVLLRIKITSKIFQNIKNLDMKKCLNSVSTAAFTTVN